MRGEEGQERRGTGEEGCGCGGRRGTRRRGVGEEGVGGCGGEDRRGRRGVGRKGTEEVYIGEDKSKLSYYVHISCESNMSFTHSSITPPHPVISLSVGLGFQSSSLPRLHHNLRSLQK